MECDACTLKEKVLFFSKVGPPLEFVQRHLKSLIYFDILDDFPVDICPEKHKNF